MYFAFYTWLFTLKRQKVFKLLGIFNWIECRYTYIFYSYLFCIELNLNHDYQTASQIWYFSYDKVLLNEKCNFLIVDEDKLKNVLYVITSRYVYLYRNCGFDDWIFLVINLFKYIICILFNVGKYFLMVFSNRWRLKVF